MSWPRSAVARRSKNVIILSETLIRGHSNDEIAMKLGVSRRTVETHWLRVSKKLSSRSLAQLQRVAALHVAEHGL